MESTGMYCLQPILNSAAPTVTLPKCMYRLPPINPVMSPSQEQLAGGDDCEASTNLAQLERRQEAILTRLTNLRSQVEEAVRQQQRSGCSTDATGAMATETVPPPKHAGDIVVVASAGQPPLSLLLLRRLSPGVTLSSHVHSTSPAAPAELIDAFSWRGTDGAAHLRLIWKPVEGEARLLVSPSGQGCPLVGEDQVFRYVSRALLPDQYEARRDASQAARVDHLLDQADRLKNGNGKEKQAVLRALNGLLGGQPYLLGAQLALVDGVVWSSLRAAALKSPSNVAVWRMRVAAAAGLGDDSTVAAAPDPPCDEASVKKSRDAGAPKAAAKQTGGKAAGKATPAKVAAAIKPSAAPAPAVAAATAPAGGHLDQAGLMALFSKLNIVSETISHPAVFTVEAMLPHLTTITGAITKNLFLRDKKKALYLLTARHDAEFRLADVARQLPGAKELRFGDEEVMFARLGVRQGCVTPLALANDSERAVRLLVDAKMLDGTFEKLWFHPLTNEATTGLSAADFKKFAAEMRHEATLINL